MSTGLIIAAVAAFLVIDAVIIYFVVIKRHRGADDLARIPVPGEGTVTLSAGKVKLVYSEGKKSASDEDEIHFAVHGDLIVEITGGSTGGLLEIKPPGFLGGSVSTGPGFSRAVIGTVEITEQGVYTIVVGPKLRGAHEPEVLVGK